MEIVAESYGVAVDDVSEGLGPVITELRQAGLIGRVD